MCESQQLLDSPGHRTLLFNTRDKGQGKLVSMVSKAGSIIEKWFAYDQKCIDRKLQSAQCVIIIIISAPNGDYSCCSSRYSPAVFIGICTKTGIANSQLYFISRVYVVTDINLCHGMCLTISARPVGDIHTRIYLDSSTSRNCLFTLWTRCRERSERRQSTKLVNLERS